MVACCPDCGYCYEKQYSCRCQENEIEELKAKLAETETALREAKKRSCEIEREWHAACKRRAKYKTALENVEKCGHDDNCLFCARKDFNSRKALKLEGGSDV